MCPSIRQATYPEVVQGRDQSRPRTDCWAFAVMTFKLLALCHPFIGKNWSPKMKKTAGMPTLRPMALPPI